MAGACTANFVVKVPVDKGGKMLVLIAFGPEESRLIANGYLAENNICSLTMMSGKKRRQGIRNDNSINIVFMSPGCHYAVWSDSVIVDDVIDLFHFLCIVADYRSEEVVFMQDTFLEI